MPSEIPKIGFRGNKNIQNGTEWHLQPIHTSYAIYARLYAYKIEIKITVGILMLAMCLPLWFQAGLQDEF